jgi:hypothetical protein
MQTVSSQSPGFEKSLRAAKVQPAEIIGINGTEPERPGDLRRAGLMRKGGFCRFFQTCESNDMDACLIRMQFFQGNAQG